MSYARLLEYISELTIIDTHEHLPPCEAERDMNNDVLGEYLAHYLSSDLVSAGLPVKRLEWAKRADIPILERFSAIRPYWDACRHTGYARSLNKAVKLIYGIDIIDINTIEALNEAYVATRAQGGAYKRVLKDISKIETSLLDCYYPDSYANDAPDTAYMTPVLNVHAFVRPGSAQFLRKLELDANARITGFDEYVSAVRAAVRKRAGSRLLKCALAYDRSLDFGKPDRERAAREFDCAIARADADFSPGRAFEDYVMHSILAEANSLGMTFQFHTGLQEGNGNFVNNSDPSLLTNLAFEYSNVTFDLFHISYPFAGKAAVMAKNFPNVTLDMCWAHIMSPRACVNTLLEWLDLVPYTKISGFGGDYCFVDGVAGHQLMARENIARALSIACDDGAMDLDAAQTIAKALLYDNPKRIFMLD